MNGPTFLLVSLAIFAQTAAFILDQQLYYQQSLEDLSAERNAIENTPKKHSVKKKDPEIAPAASSSSYEDSQEIPTLRSSELFGESPAQEPASEESDALWHRACGTKLVPQRRPESSKRSSGRKLLRGVHTVWKQLNMSVLQYKSMRYQHLYSGVHRGIEEKNYVPTWVPDRGDAVALAEMDMESREHLRFALGVFDSGLQKFAVAFEQMIEDENDPERKTATHSTQIAIRALLCEIETVISAQGWVIPPRVPRAIMSDSERRTPDFTRRMLRDWGVLLRYATFLQAWSSMVSRVYSAIITIHELRRANFWP